MSFSDDTAAFMFSGLNPEQFRSHKHEHFFQKTTAEGWVFTCDCGHSILRSNEWMRSEGERVVRERGDSPTG
jgi:hypothetical protein